MLIYLNLDNIRGEIWRPQCGRSSIGFLGKIATEKLPSMYFYCCKFLLNKKANCSAVIILCFEQYFVSPGIICVDVSQQTMTYCKSERKTRDQCA